MISRQQSRVLFWLALAAVVLLSLVPLTRATPFGYQDKMQHGLAYAALYFLSARAYVPRYPLWFLGVASVLLGIAIEFAQSLTGHRQTDIFDMLANTSGVVLVGALLSLPMMRAYLSADASYDERLRASYDDTLKALDDEPLRAFYDDTLKALDDDTLKALDDEPLRAPYDEPLKASYDDKLKAFYDEPLKASYDDTLKASYDEQLKAPRDAPRAASTESNEGG